jgi:hypothetical protein
MSSDESRLREQLAQRERALRELEIVEAAEQIIRSHHHCILVQNLARVGQELTEARQCLAATRNSGDPDRIAMAHERLCAVERTARVLQQLNEQHDVDCTRARAAFLTGRRRALETIRGLHRLILRRPQSPA